MDNQIRWLTIGKGTRKPQQQDVLTNTNPACQTLPNLTAFRRERPTHLHQIPSGEEVKRKTNSNAPQERFF